MVEHFYSDVRARIGISQQWCNYTELTKPLARRLGANRLHDLRLACQDTIDAVRKINNDVKHHGGRAEQSAEILGVACGARIKLNPEQLSDSCNKVAVHALDLLRRFGSEAEDYHDDYQAPSTTPTLFWLSRFVHSKYQTELFEQLRAERQKQEQPAREPQPPNGA